LSRQNPTTIPHLAAAPTARLAVHLPAALAPKAEVPVQMAKVLAARLRVVFADRADRAVAVVDSAARRRLRFSNSS
jgi:hypothetical protein